MTDQTKQVFVTGGAGVIGRQLIKDITAAGHRVFVGDLKERPKEFGVKVEYFQGDLNYFDSSIFRDLQVNILIHLAASFERSVESPGFFSENFRNNIQLSNYVMHLAEESRTLERVVFASSYLVYDSNQYFLELDPTAPVKLGKNSRLNPRNLIGAAKLLHEKELQHLANLVTTKYSIVIPRIYRGYGIGSRDIISRWIRSAIRGEELIAYDINGMFDYVFCKDASSGIYKLAFDSQVKGVIDLGTGTSRHVSDILAIIVNRFPNTKIRYTQSNSKVEASVADVGDLLAAINWLPKYDLESGINEIIDYELQQEVES